MWSRGKLTGVVDWSMARISPRAHEVGYCRTDLTVLIGAEAAERFRRAYDRQARLAADFGADAPSAGSDRSSRLIGDALANLGQGEDRRLFVADAASLPLAASSVAAAVSNLPFGKRAGSHKINIALEEVCGESLGEELFVWDLVCSPYPAFVRELDRILVPGGRAVLLTEEKRLLRQTLQERRFRIQEEHMLTVGGLHPSAFVAVKDDGYPPNRGPSIRHGSDSAPTSRAVHRRK